MPISRITQRSKISSETPLRILCRKYFSNAIFAQCTHLPFLNQVILRGGISDTAMKAAPVSPRSARQKAFHVALAVGA